MPGLPSVAVARLSLTRRRTAGPAAPAGLPSAVESTLLSRRAVRHYKPCRRPLSPRLRCPPPPRHHHRHRATAIAAPVSVAVMPGLLVVVVCLWRCRVPVGVGCCLCHQRRARKRPDEPYYYPSDECENVRQLWHYHRTFRSRKVDDRERRRHRRRLRKGRVIRVTAQRPTA